VINNKRLREEARRVAKRYGLRVFQPYHKNLFTDNAAMIGVCAWYQAKKGGFVENVEMLDRQPNLNFRNTD